MFGFNISAIANVCSDDLPNKSILNKEGVKFRFLTQGVSEENIFHGNIHKSVGMDNLNICIPNKLANINTVILFIQTFPVTKLSFRSSTVVLLLVKLFTRQASVELRIALSWAELILYHLKCEFSLRLVQIISTECCVMEKLSLFG